MLCALVYVPAAGENVGVATCANAIFSMYIALATALVLYPDATAIAETVFVPEVESEIAPVYCGDNVVGVEPSVV